jgi:hypothetical protein
MNMLDLENVDITQSRFYQEIIEIYFVDLESDRSSL